MLQKTKIGARHYYEYLPDLTHKCGDIWLGLPTHGMIGTAESAGLVITPACDLANQKAESIVYLPIIPVRAYFSSIGALPELKDKIVGLFKAGKFDPEVVWPPTRYCLPHPSEIERSSNAIDIYLGERQRAEKEINSLNRAKHGLSVLNKIANGQFGCIDSEILGTFFGSDWDKLKSSIVTNRYRTDIHFLPKDEQDGGFSGLSAHSVVLFRYPLAAPIEVLDLAQQTPHETWDEACAALSPIYPAANAFRKTRPLKVLSLKHDFLADLLNRYCAIYSRVGSPDFTPQSVTRISQEVDL